MVVLVAVRSTNSRRFVVPGLGLLLGCLTVAGCFSEAPEGVAPAGGGDGPRVVYDPLRRPEPELPLPNDLATRADPNSPTGRRLNLSEAVPLAVEAKLRGQLNRLDGFSVNGPITVSFDAPIDLKTAHAGTVLLINTTPGSLEEGQLIPLDFGSGAYPINIKPREVFAFDSLGELTDLLFASDNDVDGERVTHYEVETNTLILRPFFPLRPRTTYAVILTAGITGLEGQPIRSPFAWVNHTSQTLALKTAMAHLPTDAAAVAFAWTFTTRSITQDVVAIRDGMRGQGALAHLATDYPPKFARFTDLNVTSDADGTYEDVDVDPRDTRFLLEAGAFPHLLGPLTLVPQLSKLTFENVDHFVFGHMAAPDFRGPDKTIWVRDGTVDHHLAEVPFVISVPKETEKFKAPFPVVLYNHGARTSRFELVLIADSMAKAGLAMVGIDAAGHGPFGGDLLALIEREAGNFPPELIYPIALSLAQTFLGDDYEPAPDLAGVLADLNENGIFRSLLGEGRATDEDGDGVLLSGDAYFVPNPFELGSNTIQTILDNLTLLRLLQSFDASAVPPAIADPANADDELLFKSMRAGDFNADGRLDIAGVGNKYYAAGTSLGGFHTSVLLAIAPEITTGVPIVSGGGFADVMVRTDLTDAVDAILAEPLGPAIVGCPLVEGDDVVLTWNNWALKCRDDATVTSSEERNPIGRVPVAPGGTVTLSNPRLLALGHDHHEEAEHTSEITESGGFSVTVAADKGDVLQLTVLDAGGKTLKTLEVTAARGGLGRYRNSPRFRRVVQLAYSAMDFGDPLAWARYLVREPLAGAPPKNVLHIAAIGDKTVPFSSKVAFDRAVGLLGLDNDTALAVTQAFVDHEALDGKAPFWDIDDLDGDGSGEGWGPLPLIHTKSGVSGVRFVNTGHHEYIAVPNPGDGFDWATYSRNQLIRFLATDGAEIVDDVCLENSTCSFHE